MALPNEPNDQNEPVEPNPLDTFPRLRADLRISRFHAGDADPTPRYLVEAGESCFVVNQPVHDLLVAFRDEPESLQDLARSFHRITGHDIPVASLRDILNQRVPAVVFSGVAEPPRPTPFLVHFQILPSWLLRGFTERLKWLYSIPLAVVGFIAFCIVEYLVFNTSVKEMNVALPWSQLALIYLCVVLAGLFHELGHATACARFGCPHGGVGFGLYYVFPAFYADVTKAWRLSPKQRAVVDMGGLYFQLFVVVVVGLVAHSTKSTFFYQLFWIISLLMFFTLNPVFKLDGYWLLVDLSGLRNLHRRVGQTIGAFFRKLVRKPVPEMEPLQRSRKVILGLYMLLSAAFCVLIAFVILITAYTTSMQYPLILGRALRAMSAAASEGHWLTALQAFAGLVKNSMWQIFVGGFLLRMAYLFVAWVIARLRSRPAPPPELEPREAAGP
jgi:putative peptide zinc metalloprotease protein